MLKSAQTYMLVLVAVIGLALPTGYAQEPTPLSPSEWETRAPLLEPNSEIAVAELEGKIYVFGGYPSSRTTVDVVQIYDSETDSWVYGASLPHGLNHAMAASANGKVYVFGGQISTSGSGPFLNSVYEYDPVADAWTERAPMPTARSGGAAVTIEDKIYVAGGRPPHGHDFAEYDPIEDTWLTLPDLPTARNHLGAVAIDGLIYVIGGRFGPGFSSGKTGIVEVYNPADETWSTVAPMPTERSGLNAVAANGCIHVFGGEMQGRVFAEHELYNPTTDTWDMLDPMPVPVHGVTGAAFINGWIHLPGGGTQVGGSSGSTIHQVVRVEAEC